MKKAKIIFLISLILLVGFVSFKLFKKNGVIIEEKVEVKIDKGISMNLEQTAGKGDYKIVTRSDWPTEGYVFNSKLSKCENGGEVSWDDYEKIITITGNISDKCYIYFDIVKVSSITLEEDFLTPKSIGVKAKSDNSGDYETMCYYWTIDGEKDTNCDIEEHEFVDLDLNSEHEICVESEDEVGNSNKIVCKKFHTLPYTKPTVTDIVYVSSTSLAPPEVGEYDVIFDVIVEASDTNLTYHYTSFGSEDKVFESFTTDSSRIRTTGITNLDFTKYCVSVTDSYIDIMGEDFYDNELCGSF